MSLTPPIPHIPAPRLPALVQTYNWMRRPLEFLDECAARHGDLFALSLVGFGQVVILSDPDAIKEVFASSPDLLQAGKANIILKPFLGPFSVLLLDGQEHARQRRLLMPPFHGERMQAYGKVMIELTEASIDTWPLSRPFPLHRYMQQITLHIILRTVFGMREGPVFTRLATLLTEALDLIANPLLLFPWFQKDLGSWSPWGKFRRFNDEANEILYGQMDRLASEPLGERTDVLSMLVGARDEAGQPMTRKEIRDELITLLVAGHETTATALAWTFRWLLTRPDLIERLLTEIHGTLGPCGPGESANDRARGGLVPEKVARLELLDATVREALRLQPVLPLVGRVLTAPYRVLGYDLPAGSVLAPSIYLSQRRQATYKDPTRFDPDRFSRFKPSIAEWFPFGGGTRRCIGAAFALYEMKMVLATVLLRCSLLLPGGEVHAVRRSITLTPSAGLPVILTSRRPRSCLPV